MRPETLVSKPGYSFAPVRTTCAPGARVRGHSSAERGKRQPPRDSRPLSPTFETIEKNDPPFARERWEGPPSAPRTAHCVPQTTAIPACVVVEIPPFPQ
eukprot:gene16090-biopygen18761